MPPLVLSPRPRRNSAIRTPSAEPESIARATSLHSAVHPADISVTFADRPSLDMVVSPASASPVFQPDAVTVTSTASPTLAQRAARGPARRAAGGPTAVPWRHETGAYIAVGAVNIASDAFASHPSDGYFDLMLAREGKGMGEVCGLLGRYTVGKEYDSPMMDYYKASAMVITPLTRAARGQCGGWFAWLGRMCGLCACAGTACEDRTQETPLTESHDVEVLNVDGEVLSARGPFHIQHLPALMTAYGDPYRSDTHAPDGK